MLSSLRFLAVPVCMLVGGSLQANPQPPANITHAWLANALQLQREIDLNAPLREATFLGTHNSYNSKSYQTPVRYIDPNQNLSIYDQLQAGVRSIEIDTHWTWTNHFKKDILLCHAQSNHVGCGLFDRDVNEGLQEIRNWLKANPNEVVLIYIERRLDGHEPRMASELDQYLGEFIFRPTAVRDNHADPKSCVSLPTTISKADILKSGKQVVIVVNGCDGTNPDYEERDQFPQIWNNTVFTGIGNIPNQPYEWVESMIGDFTHYPDCGKSTNQDKNHTSLWRVYEDRTILSDIIHPQKKIQAEDMRELISCGINWSGLDMLTADDDRLAATIWSWAPNYPQANQGSCAVYQFGVGIVNVPCDQNSMGYVCQQETTHHFKVVNGANAWAYGEKNCQAYAGKNWHFATPVNGQQLLQVKDLMDSLNLSEAWLNYQTKDGKHWLANN